MDWSPCSICDRKCRVVPGSGPREPGGIMLLGEAPGETEDREGVPFVGKTGMELNGYLEKAGLSRETVYVTNVRKCRPPNNRTPSAKEIRVCGGRFLPWELEAMNPKLIIPMGAVAASVLEPGEWGEKLDLNVWHGLPTTGTIGTGVSGGPGQLDLDWRAREWGSRGGWSGLVYPTFHPASGLHSTRQMIPILEDWVSLGRLLANRGDWGGWIDWGDWGNWLQPQITNYREVREWDGPNGLKAYLESGKRKPGQATTAAAAIDTERIIRWVDGKKKWVGYCATLSVRAGTGVLIWPHQVKAALEWLNRNRFQLVLHNKNQDLDALEEMGAGESGESGTVTWDGTWQTPNGPILRAEDTMQYAYRLCVLPQGLKALGVRLLRTRMEDYQDVVGGAGRDKVTEWLWDIVTHGPGQADDLAVKLGLGKWVTKGKKNPVREWKWEGLGKRIKGMARYTVTNPGYDPWDKMDKEGLTGELMRVGEELGLGGVPFPGLDLVERNRAVAYACRDADITLRVYERLRNMIENGIPVSKHLEAWGPQVERGGRGELLEKQAGRGGAGVVWNLTM